MAARKKAASHSSTASAHQQARFALRADSGLFLGNVFPLQGPRTVIGRSVEAEIPVDDTQVSRNHAALDFQAGRPVVVDLGSTNGTYVNGVRVKNVKRVTVGDKIRIGSAVFVVELFDDAKAKLKKSWRSPTQTVTRKAILSPAAEAKLPAAIGGRTPPTPAPAKSAHVDWKQWLDPKVWKQNRHQIEPWALGAVCLGLLLIALSL